MVNLTASVADTVSDQADSPAIVTEERTLTYDDLWERISGFAAGLEERGVGVDDRVAIYLPNVPEFVLTFHGTLAAGGVVVPMNPQYRTREISHLLADSGAKVVVTLPDLVPVVDAVREDTNVEHVVTVGESEGDATFFGDFLGDGDGEIEPRDDDDLAVQPYTSGTTGTPKGVKLTHHNLTSNAHGAAALAPGGIDSEDSLLGVLPLFHIYGMTVCMNATLFSGGVFYPLPTWDAQQALSLIEEAELTLMHGVPAMYNDIINQPNAADFDLSSLRLAGVGGGGIPIEVLRRFEELYDAKIYEGYGLTETSPVTHFNTPEKGRRVGSIGTTIDGVSARIVNDDFEELPPVEKGPLAEDDAELDDVTGEIVIAGPNVMAGYAGLPDATAEAFTEADGKRWFHTGDIGYWDEDGFFYVVDRKKHMINTAGYNVYPREVEELLFEHPAVADAAVVGIPDERRNETVKAFVVTVPDADVTEEEIQEYCLDNLAAYKHPREVAFVDELPRTTTGKVQKFELRQQ
ncbi:long-chain-fatty-acid--CoA ligase [Haladaptatus sp. W1]|uniref:long-chain-fatty-acid--CoA ligase n=1 Tax=Haladaptatus sp. W1 TaxID=1897478 RepID=UPI000849D985|nr:long-chain fatty acid--CoA ligase [Haladaptatus sp. W1]ODR80765.1 long-chain-fatty-acid--CoA ligase [Haladaptatus sp. W1]